MRKLPTPPPAFTSSLKEAVLKYEIQLLTPMVGGGTTSWQHDAEQPIRPSSIKAQIRFWWRTMQDFATKEQLLKAESEIFGDTDQASKVRLRVSEVKSTTKKLGIADVYSRRKNANIPVRDFAGYPKYVLFPFEGLGKDKNGQTKARQDDFYELTATSTFTLTLFCSSINKEIITNCIKLWVTFGGIGARTRRGAGSLQCLTENGVTPTWFSSGEELGTWLQALVSAQPEPIPSTSPYARLRKGTLAFKTVPRNTNLSVNTNAKAAWNNLLGLDGGNPGLGGLRQGRDLGRNTGGATPGRSRWPEADSIRDIAPLPRGAAAWAHTAAHSARKWFPRAAFGLPIQFKFSTNGDPGCYGNPARDEKFNLIPREGNTPFERWPSPCLLKIVALSNGQLLAVCLLLNSRRPDLRLTGNGVIYDVSAPELPGAFASKVMPASTPAALQPLNSGEGPASALVRHLGLNTKIPL